MCTLRNIFPAKSVNLALSSHFRVVLAESYYSIHVKTLTAAARNGDSAYFVWSPKRKYEKGEKEETEMPGSDNIVAIIRVVAVLRKDNNEMTMKPSGHRFSLLLGNL